jgi:hypothetical protein
MGVPQEAGSWHPPSMRRLLDNDLLDGPHEVSTLLRPTRYARAVPVGDMDVVLAEMRLLCQVWGGAGQPMIPVVDGVMSDLHSDLLLTEQIDFLGAPRELTVTRPRRVEQEVPWDYPAIVVAAGEPRERWSRPVHVVDLVEDDPWRLIYAATLGTWPQSPDPQLNEFAGLREDLRFDEIVPIARHDVVGSLDDLLARLGDRDRLCPRQVSNLFLACGLEPDTTFLGHSSTMPEPMAIRRAAGPNIIVAVTDGSVEDVALLWNLRAAHGDLRILPIGIPAGQITPAVLAELQEPGRSVKFGWRGGRCHLTSASPEWPDLEALAALHPAVVPARQEDLLTFGPAQGRPGSQVAFWSAGRARVSPFSDGDRDALNGTLGFFRQPRLVLDLRVREHPLPADVTMRGTPLDYRFQAGAAQVSVSSGRGENTVDACWPPSWTCLEAVAQSRNLKVSPSPAGLAAATLLMSLGDIDHVQWFLHRPLVELLYQLAERSGMTWWKKR